MPENRIMNPLPKVSFKHFLGKFPEVELPVIMSDETPLLFSKENEPFPAQMIAQYLTLIDGSEPDEFTEFVPCFKVPNTAEFHAMVYWKASLMNYQYVLFTFSKKGIFIDKRVIAGTYLDGEIVTKSVATIDEDWIIHIVTGQMGEKNQLYDASTSRNFELELMPDGRIEESI